MPTKTKKPPLTSAHEKLNKQRKERYKTDAKYRKQIRKRVRTHYREHNGLKVDRDCSENIARLDDMGSTRLVKCADGTKRELYCFSLKQLCEALGGYYLDNVRDWIYKGMFPGPIHQSTVDGTGKSKMGIYTKAEVQMLLEVFSEQQQTKAYYTKADMATKRALFARLMLVRQREGYGTETQKA